MLYVFDTSSFIVMSHYFPDRFPTFWEQMDELVSSRTVVSVREVFNELNAQLSKRSLIEDWIKAHKSIFCTPTTGEAEIVSQIFKIRKFQDIVRNKQLLKGMPVADPFVVAAAKSNEGCVVSEEVEKPNSAQIPNVCKHFAVDCTNLEGFMARVGWRF